MSVENGLWVFAQAVEGKLLPVSLELLGEGRRLADRLDVGLSAILIGHNLQPLALELIACGADNVLVADHAKLYHYRGELYIPLVEKMILRYRPEIFLFGATQGGKDLAAATAARIGAGLTAHCVAFEIDEHKVLKQLVPAFGGHCVFRSQGNPQMATVAPGVFTIPEPDYERQGKIIEIDFSPPAEPATKIVEFKTEKGSAGGLEEAEVIVAGGAGVGNAENWQLIEKLAHALNAAVGATRPPVDEGWVEEEKMIGQSGRNVRPKLYLAVGISGDQLHLSGVQNPELFIAINKDPKANIFKHAHFGVVEDLTKILPPLIELLSPGGDN
ncbi:MAG: electron transfer flavoprotein subunit alpha/FixB family protein [Dethiobacteria bacterium]|jgi:electron transfer flavoprotein alpha subunit|nr:electron transfer flavoprotein subunit alpha/FixB family protein [Bacillota bacterium]